MLLTKLHIPKSGEFNVKRKDLFDKLDGSKGKRLIHISAPAGFGKSNLIADWIRSRKVPAAWFSIDKRDNDTSIFLRYLIASIQSVYKDYCKNAIVLLENSQSPIYESIVDSIINELCNSKEHFVIVLDDFHLITSTEICDLLMYFIEYLPELVTVGILTRIDSPIPLSKFRSRNQVVEVRVDDLCFSSLDIAELFNKKHNLGLSRDEISMLQSKTEGWIAGLQLTVLSLQNQENKSEFIEHFSGDSRYIMDYLMEEVLSNQDERVADFLIRTSFLEQFCESLCNYLLGITDSLEIIQHLERNNLFIIPLDNERKWFRYHHLFGYLLNQYQHRSYADQNNELNLKACEWFDRNGYADFAIEHAIQGKDYKRAYSLINENVDRLWEQGNHQTIVRYGEMIPEDIFRNNLQFVLYYSWVLISMGEMKRASEYLDYVKEHLREDESSQKLRGKLAVTYAYLYSSSGQPDKITEQFKESQKYLTESDPLWFAWSWMTLGVGKAASGNLKESSEALTYALDYGKETNNLYLISTIVTRLVYSEIRQGNFSNAHDKCIELLNYAGKLQKSTISQPDWTYSSIYAVLAYVKYMRGEMDEALENAKIGYELGKKGKDITVITFSSLINGYILYHTGDIISSRKILDKLDDQIKDENIFRKLQYSLTGSILKMHIVSNNLDRAKALIDLLDLNSEKEINYLSEMAYISYARYLIEVENYIKAEFLLNKLVKTAEAGRRTEALVEIKILFSRLKLKSGDKEKARESLVDAITLALPERMYMFFIEEEKSLKGMFSELLDYGYIDLTSGHKKFIKKLFTILSKKKVTRTFRESLSERELQIIDLMAKKKTNKEIAEELFVSVNTIKTHAKNIHLKLEVDSREEAVNRAKNLGLL